MPFFYAIWIPTDRCIAANKRGIVNKDDVRNTADEVINIAVKSPKSIAVKVTEQLSKHKGLEIEVGCGGGCKQKLEW